MSTYVLLFWSSSWGRGEVLRASSLLSLLLGIPVYSCWERKHLWQDVNQLQWCSLSAGPRLHRQSHELSPHCSLGLREICPIRLCSDGGWKSVSEDCNHRATPVNPYWSQELTQAGFLFRQLHLMVILIIPARNCCPWNPYRNTPISESTACSFSPEALIYNSVSWQATTSSLPHFSQKPLQWWDDWHYRTGS